LQIQSADSVEITTLVDDYVNGFLPASEGVNRARVDVVCFTPPGAPLLAEFGWSSLVKVKKGGHVYPILFDTGLGKQALIHNADSLKVKLNEVEAVVHSHGHPDHTASSAETVSAIGRDNLPFVIHPNAFQKRAFVFPNGETFYLPEFLNEKKLHELGARIEKNKRPTPLASESALVTGEIPRVTDFERGMPTNFHYSVIDGKLVHDPLVPDDQALIVNVKEKGLVVVSGCAHAGIVNTIKYAKEVSGVDKVHAVVGGFHLTGNFYAPIIDKTVSYIKESAPKVVIPSHCTGLRALIRISNELPDGFVENSVGSTFRF
jgi:7,8-dihydropterin-6-yl-methyl-4-(beta-D-ribofuranosyl)aminobenzene 5'-phosphate synthase